MQRDWHTKFKEELGDFAVPCMVSDRWLQFSTRGSARLEDGEYIQLWVMTKDSNDQPRKLCELVVTREDLAGVLGLIEKTP